jgi:hypothetical protein
LTKTIRRPRDYQQNASKNEVVKHESIVYVRMYCGPIVRLKVEEYRESFFRGFVHPEDENKLFLAGVVKCNAQDMCVVPSSFRVSQKEFEEEDWKIWSVKTSKK